jgi:catechol 2,3-dioxygenase-like lactoylglutathione lyase family enzyme
MHTDRPLPSRLHHTAFVVKDLDRTRRFYEDLIGLPLVATYCEESEIGGVRRAYCHCVYGLADGGALAFFGFADPADVERLGQKGPITPFSHVAFNCTAQVQSAIRERLASAGYVGTRDMDHGYCRSFYVTDPDGMNLEFTVDSDAVDPAAPTYATPHAELARWLSGDHTPNNALRETARAHG